MNGTANETLGQTSSTNWNITLTLDETLHNVTFYANDSSVNKNTGNTSLIYFYVDASAPQNTTQGHTPAAANDTVNITCYSQWSDNIGLDYGYLEHNETGTATNSTQISLSGTSGWVNYTLSSGNITPSIVQCKAYVYDKTGWVNTSTWFVNVTDATAPILESVTYYPNSTDDMDPNVMINVTANASDNVSVSAAVVQYKLTNATSWTSRNDRLTPWR